MADGSDDIRLMRAIAGGDRAALGALYDRHAGLVLAICRRVLRSNHEAEDVATDVFFELWSRADRYDSSRGSPMTYLVTLARSRAIDRKRSTDARPASGSVDLAASQPAQTASPADHLLSSEQAAKVRRAMRSLDPAQQEVLHAAYYEGLSHTQIAEKLHKPLGTVKTYIRQGLIRLRDALRIEDDTTKPK